MIDTTTLLIGIAIVWVAIGLTLSLLMGRRGHDSFVWLILGALMGPIALVMALDSWRHGESPRPEVLAEPTSLSGPVDVLVGFDGSAASSATLARVVALFGPRLGRMTLATAIPFDCGREEEARAVAALKAASAGMEKEGTSVGLEVVRGHPSHALSQLAIDGGYRLLAVGTRGAGASRLMGSAASELARHSRIPVLLVGAAVGAQAGSVGRATASAGR